MTMKVVAREEPAIYKVLMEQAIVHRLGDVVSKLVDGSHNPPAKCETGQPMLSARNIENGSINFDEFRFISSEAFALEDRRTRVTPGDVLLTIVGTIGRAAVVPHTAAPFALQRSVAVLTPTKLLPKYLAYQLQAPDVQRYFERNARGTAQKGVYLKTLSNTPVLVPSREVQQRTVAYLDEQLSRLDASVAALHRVQANLKRYRASVLKSACEGRLVPTEAELARQEGRPFETGAQLLQSILAERRARPVGRGKYKEPSAPEANRLCDSPEGWVWSNVDQLAEVGTGATPKRDTPAFYEGGHIAWVTSGVVNGEYVDRASEFVTERALTETNLTIYPPGTLLLAMYGEGKTRGRCSELRIAATTNQALAAIQATEPVRRYLRLLLERSYEETRKAASGGVQPNLNLSLVRAIAVPLPPLAEQHRIVAEADRRLSLVRVAEAQVSANLARAQRLRQSILQAAFSRPVQTA